MNNRLRRNITQFIKFCFVGGSGVIVNLAIFTGVLLLWLAFTGHLTAVSELTHTVRDLAVKKSTHGIPSSADYIANAAGFVVSVLTNYYLNRRWTFRSSGEVRRELPKFFIVSIVAYVANLGVFTLFLTRVHAGDNLSQLIAIACVMPVNFVLNKLWSFRGA